LNLKLPLYFEFLYKELKTSMQKKEKEERKKRNITTTITSPQENPEA
jgi:hypothetical protein